MSLFLSQDAGQDLVDIYVYSFQKFGEAQAEIYHQGLVDHFDSLARNSALERDLSFVKENIRRSLCAIHAV